MLMRFDDARPTEIAPILGDFSSSVWSSWLNWKTTKLIEHPERNAKLFGLDEIEILIILRWENFIKTCHKHLR